MTPEQMAFEDFAMLYPHEAAAEDWQEFVAVCQRKYPGTTEEVIRKLLEETKE